MYLQPSQIAPLANAVDRQTLLISFMEELASNQANHS
jgi:hypothetical protein